jgi:hypothetical protein
MKKYILILIILFTSFLLIRSYINLKSEVPITSIGGGGGFSRGALSDKISGDGGKASAFFETK